MRIALALILALAIAPVLARTATFGNRVLVQGDSVARVYEVAGQPNRVVTLENKFGAAVAERWEYYRNGKTIMVTVQGGKVTAISEST